MGFFIPYNLHRNMVQLFIFVTFYLRHTYF